MEVAKIYRLQVNISPCPSTSLRRSHVFILCIFLHRTFHLFNAACRFHLCVYWLCFRTACNCGALVIYFLLTFFSDLSNSLIFFACSRTITATIIILWVFLHRFMWPLLCLLRSVLLWLWQFSRLWLDYSAVGAFCLFGFNLTVVDYIAICVMYLRTSHIRFLSFEVRLLLVESEYQMVLLCILIFIINALMLFYGSAPTRSHSLFIFVSIVFLCLGNASLLFVFSFLLLLWFLLSSTLFHLRFTASIFPHSQPMADTFEMNSTTITFSWYPFRQVTVAHLSIQSGSLTLAGFQFNG